MVDHCVFDYSSQPHRMRCLHCGAEMPITLPIAIRELAAISDTFTAEHRRCRPAPTPNP